MWGEDVDWSAFARLRGVPPMSHAKDLYSLLGQFRTPEMKLRGFAVYESCGYVMFENRFRAKKVAVTFFQCSETLEVKWITPKVLLPVARGIWSQSRRRNGPVLWNTCPIVSP